MNAQPSRRYLAAIFVTAAAAFVAVASFGIATSDATPTLGRFAGSPVPRVTETVTINPTDYDMCAGLTGADVTACHTLALRPAFDNGTISDPAGPELVKECRSDTSLSPEELTACLTQPANG